MSYLIPFVRNNTLNQWIYDIDRLFEPLSEEQKNIRLNGDIEETEAHILLSFDFPGMKEGDFKVELQQDKLTISGERKREDTASESKPEGYRFYGRQFGKFNKTFALPANVDKAKIEADYRDGVLRILLPKLVEPSKNIVNVKVRDKDSQDSFVERLLTAKK